MEHARHKQIWDLVVPQVKRVLGAPGVSLDLTHVHEVVSGSAKGQVRGTIYWQAWYVGEFTLTDNVLVLHSWSHRWQHLGRVALELFDCRFLAEDGNQFVLTLADPDFDQLRAWTEPQFLYAWPAGMTAEQKEQRSIKCMHTILETRNLCPADCHLTAYCRWAQAGRPDATKACTQWAETIDEAIVALRGFRQALLLWGAGNSECTEAEFQGQLRRLRDAGLDGWADTNPVAGGLDLLADLLLGAEPEPDKEVK